MGLHPLIAGLALDTKGAGSIPAGGATGEGLVKLSNADYDIGYASLGGTGTVTSVSVTTAAGVSGSVATATTTPAITITLGAIAPTSVNTVTISGASTPTLAVTGTTTVSGANTGDQTSVSGNAGTATALQTARAINGVNFDGTAAITVTAAAGTLSGATLASGVTASSLTSVGTIGTGTWQGTAVADTYVASASTWNAKESALTFSTGLTRSTNTVTVNTTQNITKLSGLTSNGFVKTSSGDGSLSVDTATYITASSTTTLTNKTYDTAGTGNSFSINGVAVTANTGTGSVVRATSPTLITPLLGTVTSGDVTTCIGQIFATGFALSDNTAATTGTGKAAFTIPVACKLGVLYLNAVTAPTGSTLIVNVKKNGTTIFSTNVSIDATETNSSSAATPYVLSATPTTFSAGDVVSGDITQVGSTIAGAGVSCLFSFLTT